MHDSFDEAARIWAASLRGTLEEQKLRQTIMIRLKAELEGIDRFGWRGCITLRITHPEGRVKKVFLNDREI